MTAATPKSPAITSPVRTTTQRPTTNNSTQMNGVFGKCVEPVPANVASARQQQQAAQRAKANLVVDRDAKFAGNDGFSSSSGKTVGKPNAHPLLKKKAGSVPMPEENIFSPPQATVHHVRLTQQHTDPFSEERPRAEIKKRHLLVPESTTKAPRAQSVRVSEATKAKWESPFAADDVTNSVGVASSLMYSNGENSPSASSPTRSSLANSPQWCKAKRCARLQEGSEIFKPLTEEELSPSVREASQNSRFKLSHQGLATMHDPLTEAEISKERSQHRRIVNAPQTTMEGVFTVVEKKSKHPNYKFSAPFARQGSVAATVRIGGRRHKAGTTVAQQQGEVVSPFATNLQPESPPPAEFSGARPKKVFAGKHSTRTPFAREGSLAPSQRANYARRVYKQAASMSPYAVDE